MFLSVAFAVGHAHEVDRILNTQDVHIMSLSTGCPAGGLLYDKHAAV